MDNQEGAAADLNERLARLKARLDGQGRHRDAEVVARAMAENAPAARTRADLR